MDHKTHGKGVGDGSQTRSCYYSPCWSF